MPRRMSHICSVAAVLACGPSVDVEADDTTSEATSSLATSTDPATSSSSSGGDSASTSTTSTTSSTADTGVTTTTANESTEGCPPLLCSGSAYACVDGYDNDGDGAFDLDDPECTSVCDHDESSFQTDIVSEGDSCHIDCFFDASGGPGDDGCRWLMQCDPEGPGAGIGCPYTASDQCDALPPALGRECVAFCSPFALPGCDCFGCCTIDTPQGPRNVSLLGDPDCNAGNLDSCATCTSHIEECGNPCTPDACEICFGSSGAPPEGCATNVCDFGSTCSSTDDCSCGEFCELGCCYPSPP